ncbi:MAG: helix-turn-helix transcriptional regulator [Lachnospiraceae bacterium]|nr:helix-turn-helix transcriptional regulator [Lachnospiraceae bacterium]
MSIAIAYPTINAKATGERIKALRIERGLKIREISEFMGFTTDQAVCKWQRGESLPTLDNLYALSKLFGIQMEDILVGDDKMSFVFWKERWFDSGTNKEKLYFSFLRRTSCLVLQISCSILAVLPQYVPFKRRI